MKQINYTHTGGFPLTANTLKFTQEAYSIMNSLGALAGNLAIIKGCVVTGSTVSDGVVYINGEVLEFRGGVKTSFVVVIEVPTNDIFEDGTSKVVFKERYATFGQSGGVTYDWENFYRVNPLEVLEARIKTLEEKKTIFKGMVFIWNKAANLIPAGWQETTDFAGKTLFGHQPNDADFGTLAQTGGEKKHTMTESEMPAHSHSYTDIYYSETGGSISVPGNRGSGDTDYDNSGWTRSATTSTRGGGTPFNVLNPYRVVKFIEPINDL